MSHVSVLGWVAGAALGAASAWADVSAPYANDFTTGDVSAFTEQPSSRWSSVSQAYRYVDVDADVTNVSDWAAVTVTNLGGIVQSNFIVSARFTIQTAGESPAGTGERLAIMLAALADSTMSTGYFFSVGAGEDIVGFEEGMAFYKNGTYSGQATNYIIQGPVVDGSETWKLTVRGEYLPGNQIRFGLVAVNETDALTVSNSWTDTSGSVCTGRFFGVVVAHTRYVSSVVFDDFEVAYQEADGGFSLPAGVFFREEFTSALADNGWTVQNSFPVWYAVSNGICWPRVQSGEMLEASFNYYNLFAVDITGVATGDYCATMRVLSFQPTNDNAQLNLLLYDDNDNHVRASYGHIGGARILRLFEETDGAASAPLDAARDFGAGPFWLRLTRQGNVYRQYWSTNGTIFHKANGPVTYGSGPPASLAFWAGANNSFLGNPTTVAQIDAIEIGEFPDHPAVTGIRKSGGAVTIAVQNLYEATTARVDRCTNLASNDWTSLGDFVVSGDSTNVVDAALPSTNRFFYRAVLR